MDRTLPFDFASEIRKKKAVFHPENHYSLKWLSYDSFMTFLWIAATHGYPAQTQPFPAQEAPAFRPPRLPTASAAPSPSPRPPRSRAAAAAWRAAGGGAKSPGLRAARSTWKWRGRCAANEGLTMKHADFSVKHVEHVDFAGKNVDLTMNNNE
jgi:hypothetical protein